MLQDRLVGPRINDDLKADLSHGPVPEGKNKTNTLILMAVRQKAGHMQHDK